MLFPAIALAQTCDQGGPLTVAQLESLGITAATVTQIVLRAFAVILGFWAMGYTFGLLVKAIRRA